MNWPETAKKNSQIIDLQLRKTKETCPAVSKIIKVQRSCALNSKVRVKTIINAFFFSLQQVQTLTTVRYTKYDPDFRLKTQKKDILGVRRDESLAKFAFFFLSIKTQKLDMGIDKIWSKIKIRHLGHFSKVRSHKMSLKCYQFISFFNWINVPKCFHMF